MKISTSYIFAVVLALILSGCKKELDLRYKDIEPLLVIEGQMSLNDAFVRITTITPMDEPMDTTLLTDAYVSIIDITEGSVFKLAPDSLGVFRCACSGIPGHEYELTVERGGNCYLSKSIMPAPIQLLGLQWNWINMPYDQVAVLQVTFTENREVEGDCYWVRLYRNGKAYMWDIIYDMYARDGIINDIFMTSRRDLDEEDEATALRDGDVVTASVSPISRHMLDYLEAVSSDSNGPAMFSGDPCLGYFLASPTVEASIPFRPDEIKEY